MAHRYRMTVLEELARHGIIPREDTPPELIHEFVNNLYLVEIRALKQRRLAGEIARRDYSGRVEALRRRYPILSLPIRFWFESND